MTVTSCHGAGTDGPELGGRRRSRLGEHIEHFANADPVGVSYFRAITDQSQGRSGGRHWTP